MNYRLALAVLYVLLMAVVAAVLVYRLNPAAITAIPIPFVTLAAVTRARRRVRRHGDRARGTSGDERGTSGDEHNVWRAPSRPGAGTIRRSASMAACPPVHWAAAGAVGAR